MSVKEILDQPIFLNPQSNESTIQQSDKFAINYDGHL